MLERSQRRSSLGLHQVRRASGLCPRILALCLAHSHLVMLIANHCMSAYADLLVPQSDAIMLQHHAVYVTTCELLN